MDAPPHVEEVRHVDPRTPSIEDRLLRIRELTDRHLRRYATAYVKTPQGEEHLIAERDLLRAYMVEVASIVALVEGDDLDDGAMMRDRRQVIDRYLRSASDTGT